MLNRFSFSEKPLPQATTLPWSLVYSEKRLFLPFLPNHFLFYIIKLKIYFAFLGFQDCFNWNHFVSPVAWFLDFCTSSKSLSWIQGHSWHLFFNHHLLLSNNQWILIFITDFHPAFLASDLRNSLLHSFLFFLAFNIMQVRQFRAKLRPVHVGLHCNANEDSKPRKWLLMFYGFHCHHC